MCSFQPHDNSISFHQRSWNNFLLLLFTFHKSPKDIGWKCSKINSVEYKCVDTFKPLSNGSTVDIWGTPFDKSYKKKDIWINLFQFGRIWGIILFSFRKSILRICLRLTSQSNVNLWNWVKLFKSMIVVSENVHAVYLYCCLYFVESFRWVFPGGSLDRDKAFSAPWSNVMICWFNHYSWRVIYLFAFLLKLWVSTRKSTMNLSFERSRIKVWTSYVHKIHWTH